LLDPSKKVDGPNGESSLRKGIQESSPSIRTKRGGVWKCSSMVTKPAEPPLNGHAGQAIISSNRSRLTGNKSIVALKESRRWRVMSWLIGEEVSQIFRKSKR